MLASLKNSSSVKSPNFLHQKLKMPEIKFCFNRKMCPSMESYPSLLLLMNYGERPKKRSPRFCNCKLSSSQARSDTMLYFYEEINPMLVSLKNSSFVRIPNFLHQKLKMLRIEFCFNRKMHPSMESYPSILLLVDCGERPKR